MNTITMTDEQRISKIKERVEFATENKNVPFIFSAFSGYHESQTDAKDKQAVLGNYILPAVFFINANKGDGLKKHIIIYNNEDDIHESHAYYRNANGRFEEPNVKPITLEGQKIAVYGDSLKSIRLLEYLSYIELFDNSLKCQDLTENIKATQPQDVLSAEMVVKYITLIDELSNTEQGFDLILSISKNAKLNPNYSVIDGLLKMPNGKKEIISIVKQFVVTKDKAMYFASLITPSKQSIETVKKSINDGFVAFDKEVNGFRQKTQKGYSKDILFTTDAESDEIKQFLFALELGKSSILRSKVEKIVSEIEK